MTPSSFRIRIIGDPVLRSRSRELEFPADTDYLKELLTGMRKILAEEEGLGLAAPQVGHSARVFIATPDYLEDLKGHTVFINPRVEPFGPAEKREEGCLSVPGIWESLERPSRARITAQDETGKEFTLEVEGLSARLFQHETDHLDGILFTDKLSPMKKKLLKRKLNRLREEGSSR